MVDALQKLGPCQFIAKFLEEKIISDIVCKLSSYEFRLLGVVVLVSSDMMSLRVYCSKYGRYTPQKLPNRSGAPKFNMPKYMLEKLLEEGFTTKKISAMICVARKELYTDV